MSELVGRLVRATVAALSRLVRGRKQRQISPTPATLILTATVPGVVTGNGAPYEIPFLINN